MISKLQALLIAAVALTAAGALILMDTDGYQDDSVRQSNDYDYTDGTFYYKLGSTAVIVQPDTGYYESKETLIVPATVTCDGTTYNVTQIAADAFQNSRNLASIDLSQAANLKQIGDGAFKNSQIYCDIVLPGSVETIGKECFFGSYIKSFDASNTNLTTIPESAFFRCQTLQTVDLPHTVTTIGNTAFISCTGLRSINLEELDGAVTIGSDAFTNAGCGADFIMLLPKNVVSIQESSFCDTNTSWFAIDGGSQATSVIMVDANGCILSKDENTFLFYPGKNPRIQFTVPDTIERLGDYAFYGASNLRHLTIDNFIFIPSYAFGGNEGVTHLTITQTESSAQDGEFQGIIKEFFCRNNGSWRISNQNIGHVTIDTAQELDLTGMKQNDPNHHVDFTSRTTQTTGGNFNGADQRAGNRFTSVAMVGASDIFTYDNTRTVTATQSPQNEGGVTGAGSYKIDTSVTLTATPFAGYQFDKWVDESGKTVSGAGTTYTFELKGDVVYVACFKPFHNTTVRVPTGVDLILTQHLDGHPDGYMQSDYNYYTFKTVKQDGQTDNPDGTTTYTFSLDDGVYAIIVTGEIDGEPIVTYKELFTKDGKGEDILITRGQLLPEGKTWDTVDRSLSKQDGKPGNDVGGILVSGNKQNSVYIKQGETRNMMVYRSWQAVGDTLADNFLEPELVCTITDLNNNPTEGLKFTVNGTDKGSEFTGYFSAVTNGTYIATFYQKAFTINYDPGSEMFYGATWPELTDVLVVTVNNSGLAPALDSNMVIADAGLAELREIDSEIDVFYYIYGEKGYNFSFVPDSSVTQVNVYNPKITDFNKPGIDSFEKVAGTKDGDKWTVLLKEGRNIVEISDGTKTVYQVLTAMPVKVTVNGKDISAAKFIHGENTVVFLNPHNDKIGGIYNLKGKLAGLYNTAATIDYAYENGDRVPTAIQPTSGNYFFMTSMQYQTLTVTVPETAAVDSDFTINGYGVVLTGDPETTDHRGWFELGSPLGIGYSSVFPDITVKVGSNQYGARLSADGGQNWDNYDTFAQAMEKAADGNIIELGSTQDAAKIGKAIELRLSGFSLTTTKTKPLEIASAVTFKGAPSVESPVFIKFDNGQFLTSDTNFFMTQMFDSVSSWSGKAFASGFETNDVSLSAAGYAQTEQAGGKLAVGVVTERPFGIWSPNTQEFVFFKTIEEALQTGADRVYVLSYVPLYEGGHRVYEYDVEGRITEDVALETVYRVTDGTVSSFYVNGSLYYSNGTYDIDLPKDVSYAVLNGTLTVEEDDTLMIVGVKVLADIILDGGYDGKEYYVTGTVKMQSSITDYKLHIGFTNIEYWYDEITTETGHLYELKELCHYRFIESTTSLADRVSIIHSGFKASLIEDDKAAILVGSQDMIAYTYINGVAIGYSDLVQAIKQAQEQAQDQVYFTYYTNTQDPDANIYIQELNRDIDYDSLGLIMRTIHHSTDGKTSNYSVVDGSRVILRFTDGHQVITSNDIDLTCVIIDGTVVMKGQCVATFLPKNSGSVADPVVTLDLTAHDTGLVAKGISGVNYKVVLPAGTDSEVYEVVEKDDCLYLQIHKESSKGGINVWIIVGAVIAILAVAGVAVYFMKAKGRI